MELFLELVQVALGVRDVLSRAPSADDWKQIQTEAQRQAVLGIVVHGIDRLPKEQRPQQQLLLELIGISEMLRQRNAVLNKRSAEIQEVFEKARFRSCILKGQGNAMMYPNPYSRMPGDIDIWVDGERETINQFVDGIGEDVHKGYKDIAFWYKEVEVEAHYFPTYLNSFSKNKELQKYIEENREQQFTHFVEMDEGHKICVPTLDFNIVYQMCHLYHHFFCEGIGLRHFIDYFYLLKNADFDKVRTLKLFRALGLQHFLAGVMWVEKEVLGIESRCLLATPEEKIGKLILKEIKEYGNFGHSEMEGKSVMTAKLSNTFRPVKCLFKFPKESIDRIMFLCRLQWWKLSNK